MDVYADASYAGCKTSRKSTSSGCIKIGSHTLRTWCKTQSTVTLSSGEAELLAAVRGSCEALGAKTLLQELGTTMGANLHVDASAALGIMH